MRSSSSLFGGGAFLARRGITAFTHVLIDAAGVLGFLNEFLTGLFVDAGAVLDCVVGFVHQTCDLLVVGLVGVSDVKDGLRMWAVYLAAVGSDERSLGVDD